MKSETITVEQLFQNRRQYCVPFYQRAYVWTLDDQWEQLWDDIRDKTELRLANGKLTPHFLGAVVMDPRATSPQGPTWSRAGGVGGAGRFSGDQH